MKQIQKQNKQHFAYKALLLCLAVIFSLQLSAKEYSKEYTGSVDVEASDILSLSLSHAKDVVIKTTDESTVSYEIKLVLDVKKDDNENVEELLNAIDFSPQKTGNKLDVGFYPFNTFTSSGSGIFGKTTIKLKNGKKFKFSGQVSVNIYIEATIPKQNSLELNSSFSTSTLGHLSGTADIKLSHSTLKANDIEGLNLDASFSKISVGNVDRNSTFNLSQSELSGLDMGNFTAQLSFSTIETANSGNIEISSLSQSTLKADNVENLNINSSSFSTIDINKAENVKIEKDGHSKYLIEKLDGFKLSKGSFTRINIEELTSEFEVFSQHTNIKIGTLGRNINHFKIKNTFASITFGTTELADFNLFVKDSQFTTVKKTDEIEKKADGFYRKQTTSKTPLEMEVSCSNCTINLQ